MKTIENLLVTVPASPAYQSTVVYAIELAKELRAALTIALVYTCNNELAGQKVQDKSALHEQKNFVKDNFRRWRRKLEEESLEFKLASIDGPLVDAMFVASLTYHPDLVISTADPNLPITDMKQRVSCHLLLIPPSFHYRDIRLVALAHDPNTLPEPKLISFIGQLASDSHATVEVVQFEPECDPASPLSLRANAELDYLFRNVAHRFYLNDCHKDLAECISQYVHGHSADMIVLAESLAFPHHLLPLTESVIDVILNSEIPVMVLKR